MSLLLLLLALQAGDAEAGAALEKFRIAFKAKEAEERAAAVTELAKTQHEKVVVRLGQLLTQDQKEVRMAAARGLGAVSVADLKQKAVNHLAKALAPNAAEVNVAIAIVDALEEIAPNAGLVVLHQHFTSPAIPVARTAIEVAERFKRRESVPPLVALVKYLEVASREALNVGPEGRREVVGGGLPGAGAPVDPEAPRREKVLKPAALKALETITKKSFKTAREWETWWKEKGADFKSGR